MRFRLIESTIKNINIEELKHELREKIGKDNPSIKIDVLAKSNSTDGHETITITLLNDSPFFDAEVIVSKQRGGELLDITINGKISKKYESKQITKKTISEKRSVEDIYDFIVRTVTAVADGLTKLSVAASSHVSVKAITNGLVERIKYDLKAAFPNVQVTYEPIEHGYEINVTSDKPYLDISITLFHNTEEEKVHVGVSGKFSADEKGKTLNHQSISSMNTIDDLIAFASKTFSNGYSAYIKVQKNRDKGSRQSNIKMY